MFRQTFWWTPPWQGFPRARGDVPCTAMSLSAIYMFSPRTRGCSPATSLQKQCATVFPAHAGMFPCPRKHKSSCWRFPRARGDVPPRKSSTTKHSKFSPRTRGCSVTYKHWSERKNVFPAHAGMFLSIMADGVDCVGFPRARGDVPAGGTSKHPTRVFSPRTRGCSALVRKEKSWLVVFPAHAGMFPSPKAAGTLPACFPRARGDVP